MRPASRPCGRCRLRYLAPPLLLAALAISSACGGGSDDQQSPPNDLTETAAAAATAAPQVPAEITSPAEAFARLQSYRVQFHLALEGIAGREGGLDSLDLQGAFQAPDRSHVQVNARLGDLDLQEESITVAERTWVKVGEGWVEQQPQLPLDRVSPTSLLDRLGPEQLRLYKPSRETVNGVESLRYSLGRGEVDAVGQIAALLGVEEELKDASEVFDLWLAENGGWPARVTISVEGTTGDGMKINLDFSLDITNVNDPAIVIEPPA